jgi:hypothetical protein
MCFSYVGYFETPPTLCEVCDGKDYDNVLTAKGKT